MNRPSTPHDEQLAHALGLSPSGAAPRGRWRLWLALTSLVVLAVIAYALLHSGGSGVAGGPQYRTAVIQRGDLTVSVSATGNVQPTNQVDVGSELSGTVEAVLVDENDHVRRGQLLARLDVSRLQDQIARSRGAVAAARAQVDQAAATVKERRLNVARLQHMAKLSGGTLPSPADLDAAEAALQRAIADEASAHAAVTQSSAALRSDETSLTKASIRSPIDGVVLTRKVEPGQTVAASLQAPVLFTLAENLSQMELQVDVDEADVGQVRDGQQATFTVDAYPNRHYPAVVRRVNYGSQIKDGVVSYLTVLGVENDDLSLRPGMTATAAIVTAQVRDALLVPSAALRFSPAAEETGSRPAGSFVNRLLPHPPHASSNKPANTADGERRVWVLRNGQAIAVPVTVGATDGRMTVITGGALEAGVAVITEAESGAR